MFSRPCIWVLALLGILYCWLQLLWALADSPAPPCLHLALWPSCQFPAHTVDRRSLWSACQLLLRLLLYVSSPWRASNRLILGSWLWSYRKRVEDLVILASLWGGKHSWRRLHTMVMRQFSQSKQGCLPPQNILGGILCPWERRRDREGSVSLLFCSNRLSNLFRLSSLKQGCQQGSWFLFQYFQTRTCMYISLPVAP